ncbi:MAG TPA: hypothetical protein IAC09_00725 [Candidatus Cryptobacteroides intestinipullorum]|nr:hypothetical protein [Candidatus Cryptobacteroides intestinipullorum]
MIVRLQRQVLSVSEIQDTSELERNLNGLERNLNGLERNLNMAMTRLQGMARQTLVRTVIAQAISSGLVTREHPESPRHPRQRYLLTEDGLKVLEVLMKK